MFYRRHKTILILLLVFLLGLGILTNPKASFYFHRFPLHRLPSGGIFDQWRIDRTQKDIAAASLAIQSFDNHYGRLPFNSLHREDQFSIILGHELNAINTGTGLNKDKIVFWNLPAGSQRDAWGREYHYYFDHDHDGIVNPGRIPLNKSFAVWSEGLNGIDEGGNGDDLRDW